MNDWVCVREVAGWSRRPRKEKRTGVTPGEGLQGKGAGTGTADGGD